MRLFITTIFFCFSISLFSQNTKEQNISFLTGKWKMVDMSATAQEGYEDIPKDQWNKEEFAYTDSIISFETGYVFKVNNGKKGGTYRLESAKKIYNDFSYEIYLNDQLYEITIYDNYDNDIFFLSRKLNDYVYYSYQFNRIKK